MGVCVQGVKLPNTCCVLLRSLLPLLMQMPLYFGRVPKSVAFKQDLNKLALS